VALGKGDHLIRSLRRTTDAKATVAPGDQAARDGVKNLVEHRIANEPVKFRVVAQLAEDGDTVNDVTIQWPESRKLVELGKLSFTEPVLDEVHEQKQIIFDPIPRVDGIDASDDPLLELRAAVYLISGRRRRSAPE